MSSTQTTPEVLWAQRSSTTEPEKNYIYLTISAPDVQKIDVDLKSTSLSFTGHSDTKKTTYHVEFEFFGEIDVDNSKTNHTSRDVEFVLRKKELKQEYWPRLLKESKKVHFLKTDFDKWVDEDEQDEAPEDDPNLGGMGNMGGGGMGDIDFSKLGGMGGAGGLGEGLGDVEGLGGEEDDDDMPDLEDEGEEVGEKSAENPAEKPAEEAAKPASSGSSSKIEEVP